MAQQPGVGKWTRDEHMRYLQAIKIYPQGPWQSVANYVGTRSARQTQTHAQKYREKVSRRKRGLLRKRAMSDEWLENQSASSDEVKYSTSQVTSLPALTVKSDQYGPNGKTFHDSLPPPPRLPVLEPIHLQTSYHPSSHEMDKSYPPGGFQASLTYPPPLQTHHYPPSQHHPFQNSTSLPPSYSYSSYSHPPGPTTSSHRLHHSPHDGHHVYGQRVAPPLEELLQFFVDDVEFTSHHRDRQMYKPI